MNYGTCPPVLDRGEFPFASMGDIRRASQAYRNRSSDPVAIEVLQGYRQFRIRCIETSLEIIDELPLPEHVLISARLKRMKSIRRKLTRSSESTDVGNIDDVIGFRLIFRSFADLLAVVDAVHARPDIRVKNYLEEEHPNGHGYRGAHAIFRFKQPFMEGKNFTVRFEVQLRTYYQHQWACWCESWGEQAKEGYLNRRNDPEIIERVGEFKSISDRVKSWEENNRDTIQGNNISFPVSKDIRRRFAVVWPNGDVDTHDESVGAFNGLIHLEEQRLDALLLLGLSGRDVARHLKETHYNFLFGEFFPPEIWMPPGA